MVSAEEVVGERGLMWRAVGEGTGTTEGDRGVSKGKNNKKKREDLHRMGRRRTRKRPGGAVGEGTRHEGSRRNVQRV